MAFTITDAVGKQVQVTVTTNKRAQTKMVFSPAFEPKDGGWIGYIETNFLMHYAPDVAESIKQVWEYFPEGDKLVLTDMLLQAALCVGSWDLRDAKDALGKMQVLSICRECGLDVDMFEIREERV